MDWGGGLRIWLGGLLEADGVARSGARVRAFHAVPLFLFQQRSAATRADQPATSGAPASKAPQVNEASSAGGAGRG